MSSARTTRLAALGAATIGALFAAGIGSELFPTLKDQLETSSFLPAQGQIASCEVRGTPPRVPEIEVSYRYVYGEREYEGNRWRAIPFMLDREDYEAVCGQLLAHPNVSVFVNPADPRRVTLEPGLSGADYLLMVFFLGCLGTAVVFAWGGIRMTLPGSRRDPFIQTVDVQLRIHAKDYPGGITLRWMVLVPWALLAILIVGWGRNPPMVVVERTLAVVAILAAASWVSEWRAFSSGRSAFVIDGDRRLLMLPKRLGHDRMELALDHIDSIGIVEIPYATAEDTGINYAIAARRQGHDSINIIDHPLVLARARDLAVLLAHEITNRRTAGPVSVSLNPLPLSQASLL
jgi:Protein of unknown function (DUF3592)